MTAPGKREGNRALTYLRVSTDDQATSVEAQRSVCARIAAQNGYEIVGEYVDEGVSGTKRIDQRPALKRALADLASGKADRLIVSKLDRLARNVRVVLEIEEDHATRHGWGIVLGDMQIDTSTAVGKMQLSMFASVARFERDRISERTREALAVKKAQGIRLGRPSALPIAIVQRIVTERVHGQSLRKIAEGLTRDGIPTGQGGQRWHASTVRKVLAGQQASTFENLKDIAAVSESPLLGEGARMFGVWQTGRLFHKGAPPNAISADLSRLQAWAESERHMQWKGSTPVFFVESVGAVGRWSEQQLVCVGHLRRGGQIEMRRKDPAIYVRMRANAIASGCVELTDEERGLRTVNLDQDGGL